MGAKRGGDRLAHRRRITKTHVGNLASAADVGGARAPLEGADQGHYTSGVPFILGSARLETHGPFATLWVGLGLGCFYIALIWLNTLLGFLLTPLFVIPATSLMDRLGSRRTESNS